MLTYKGSLKKSRLSTTKKKSIKNIINDTPQIQENFEKKLNEINTEPQIIKKQDSCFKKLEIGSVEGVLRQINTCLKRKNMKIGKDFIDFLDNLLRKNCKIIENKEESEKTIEEVNLALDKMNLLVYKLCAKRQEVISEYKQNFKLNVVQKIKEKILYKPVTKNGTDFTNFELNFNMRDNSSYDKISELPILLDNAKKIRETLKKEENPPKEDLHSYNRLFSYFNTL